MNTRGLHKVYLVSVIFILIAVLFGCERESTPLDGLPVHEIMDFDGNTYPVLKIGEQWWMSSNLRCTHYADGSEIPFVEKVSEWKGLDPADKAYCYYGNDVDEAEQMGALYTWGAAVNGWPGLDENPSGIQGVCPDGWHLPSDAEWKELEMHLGLMKDSTDVYGSRGEAIGSQLAGLAELWYGGSLKDHEAFGSSGFHAPPGGGRRYNGTFGHRGDNANYWSATAADAERAWGRHLYSTHSSIHRYTNVKSDGFSVRCVKD